jgi:hypothetical protein
MSEGQLQDVLRVCHRYPDIQLTYQLSSGTSVAAGDQVQVVAELERDWSEGDLSPVDAPRCAPLLCFPICICLWALRSRCLRSCVLCQCLLCPVKVGKQQFNGMTPSLA